MGSRCWLARRNEKEQAHPAAEHAHDGSWIQGPDPSVEAALKPPGWFVQQQISRAEFLANLNLVKTFE